MSEENITEMYIHVPVPDDSNRATEELVRAGLALKIKFLRAGFEPLPTMFQDPDVIILTFRRESRLVRIRLRPV